MHRDRDGATDPDGRRPDPGREGSSGVEALGDRQAGELVRLVGGLAGAGLALPGGLRAMAEEAEPGPLRQALLRVADSLERGESLDEAIEAEGPRLPEHLLGIVRAAAKSGRMAKVFAESSRLERIGAELRRQLWLRLAYPTMLMSAFVVLFVLLAHFVVPDFEAIFEDFALELPPVTLWLLSASRLVVDAGWAVIAGLLLAWLVVWLAGRGIGRGARRRVVNGVPMLGSLWRNAAMAEFSHLIALLIECELPMPRALAMAGEGTRDVDLAAACRRAAEGIEQGRSLSDVVASNRLYPNGAGRLIAWSESHGALPGAFRMIGELYEARARSQAILIGLFALVVAVVIVLMGVQMILLGLYLPMIRLISVLSGMICWVGTGAP